MELTTEEKQAHDEIFREVSSPKKRLNSKEAIQLTKLFWESLQITEAEQGGNHLSKMYLNILEYLENSQRITN